MLIELVQDDAEQTAPTDLAQNLMAGAIELGLADDATLSANEAQAEAFWKIRDSISEAERAEGPALQHDISVPVADMARFIEAESPVIEARLPRNTHCRLWPFGRRQYPLSCQSAKGHGSNAILWRIWPANHRLCL